MRPEYEPKTLEQRLGYLVEECGEVLAAAGKTLRWGQDSNNPECLRCGASVMDPRHGKMAGGYWEASDHAFLPQPETNRQWLLRELSDLEGAIARVREALK